MSKSDRILVNEIFNALIENPEAKELDTFGREDLQSLARGIPHIKDIRATFDIALKIKHEFPFNELELRDTKSRSLFSLAIAQSWFLDKIGISSYHGNLSAFAVLLGTNYSLNINIHQTVNDLSNSNQASKYNSMNMDLSIEYNRIFEEWAELERLGNASVMSKKCLILIARLAHPTYHPWISLQDLPDYETLKPFVKDLAGRKLVNDHPTPSDLLVCLKNEALKKFSVKQGLIPPTRKQDIVEFVKKNCTDIQIKELIESENIITSPLRPTILNLNEFRQYIFTEMDRLGLYYEWITVFKYRQPYEAILHETTKNDTQVQSRQDLLDKNDFQSVNPTGDTLLSSEKKLVAKYWDVNCDVFLQKAIDENRKRFPLNAVINQVVKYWEQSGKLEAFKEDTMLWNSFLSIFVETKLLQNEYYQLEPVELICKGCGKKFLKSSIFIRTAVRVEMNIQFCYSCYVDILYEGGENRKKLIPEKDSMLSNLFELCKETNFIPTKKIMKDFPLPSSPTEKQIQIGRLLLKMPQFETYVSTFGSWLSSLSQAKVVDKYLETPRGIQCIAEDEHVCLSLGEKTIDDWLHRHGIHHEKEILYFQDAELNPQKKLRSDWKVGNIFIEYAGMMQEGNYYANIQRKQKLAEKLKFTLVILEPEDIKSLDSKLGFLKANN